MNAITLIEFIYKGINTIYFLLKKLIIPMKRKVPMILPVELRLDRRPKVSLLRFKEDFIVRVAALMIPTLIISKVYIIVKIVIMIQRMLLYKEISPFVDVTIVD